MPAIAGRIRTRALATTTATAAADFGKTFRFEDLDIAEFKQIEAAAAAASIYLITWLLR